MMTLSRSIHEIVWALFFVAAVGLGALAGVLAIAMRSIGFIAKMSAFAGVRVETRHGDWSILVRQRVTTRSIPIETIRTAHTTLAA